MQIQLPPPVLKIALPVPLRQFFDYLPAVDLPTPVPGQRVVVSFGHRRLVGVVVDAGGKSTLPMEKLARVESHPDGEKSLFDAELLKLLRWCWRYYKHAPGEVVFSALPPLLRKPDGVIPALPPRYRLTPAGTERLGQPVGRIKAQMQLLKYMDNGPVTPAQLRAQNASWKSLLSRLLDQHWVCAEPQEPAEPRPKPGPQLLDGQKRAVADIAATLGEYRCHLLDGITGSGKTEVYLKVLEQVLERGGQALLLVPEIGLTPQLVSRFTKRLGFEPVVTHSGLSEGQRLQAWAMASNGLARLVIGTRSALFLPLPDLQLLILDEEHDASFKQQDGFRYSTRDVAVKRAAGLGIPVVLGTATPSLETFNNAVHDRYSWHRLRQRATGAAEPRWRILDLVQQTMQGGMSTTALDAIGKTLQAGEQALIFLNRRGYAPVILCHECGWHAACPNCDANMTWHRGGQRLLCHHCDCAAGVPVMCPDCGADALMGAGEGTEQLEGMLTDRFNDVPLLRFDRDTVRRRGEFHRLSEQVKTGEPCILVGTQMIAKGHHFPRVTLVVIVNLDQALYSADFRALERMGQLMLQVAGRAGREQLPGEVILQTHYPQHESLGALLKSGYEAFANGLCSDRETAALPPFTYQALLRADAVSKADVRAFLQQAKRCFPAGGAGLFGPFPAMMERRGGRTRWYLLVQSDKRSELHGQLDAWLGQVQNLSLARRVRWVIDVDPQDY